MKTYQNFMKTYQNFNDAYHDLLLTIDEHGIVSNPRGHKCHELRPYAFQLLDPLKSLYTGASRRLSYRFYAIEMLSYLSGCGEKWVCDLLIDANKNLAQFLNPKTGLFDGLYGPRLVKSLFHIEKHLIDSPDSRQEVASLWSPEVHEQFEGSRDRMCTESLQFINQASEGEKPILGLVVKMRSNDVNFGSPYDIASFSTIQVLLADRLGWDIGTYTHVAGSFHVYDNQRPTISPPFEETWLDVSIPRHKFGLDDMETLSHLSRQALYEVYLERQLDHPWSVIRNSGFESIPFFKQCFDLIRLGRA